jgi:hypothetical protein
MEGKTLDLAGALPTIHQNQRGEEMNFLTFVLSNGVINRNKQTGPSQIQKADIYQIQIDILTLHENSLSGTMPESVCDLRRNYNLKYLMADCKGPNPKVVCDCCTHCSPY